MAGKSILNGKREAFMIVLDTLISLKVVRGNRGTPGMSASFSPCPSFPTMRSSYFPHQRFFHLDTVIILPLISHTTTEGG